MECSWEYVKKLGILYWLFSEIPSVARDPYRTENSLGYEPGKAKID